MIRTRITMEASQASVTTQPTIDRTMVQVDIQDRDRVLTLYLGPEVASSLRYRLTQSLMGIDEANEQGP